jgi:hypothetical protein
MLQALGEVVERPAGAFVSEKMVSLDFSTCICSFVLFVVNIWPSSCGLRPSNLMLVNRGAACGPAALRTVLLIARKYKEAYMVNHGS